MRVAERCVLVAEVAQAHDGSLGTAHSYIDAAADNGADVIKFQAHIADAESHPSEPWRVRFSQQDNTRHDYWRRMEFSAPQWRSLYEHARDRGLAFMVSPFSTEAVDLLVETGVDMWKVASGELLNPHLIERLAMHPLPTVLSCGMSTLDELDRPVQILRGAGAELTLLQCTTSYPTPPESLGLNILQELRERFRLPVGLSDHSGTIFAGIAATVLGASMVECHLALSPYSFGPDTKSSIRPHELAELRRGIDFVVAALDHPVDKAKVAEELASTRLLFTRSIVTRRDIGIGERLSESDLALKKPGTGLRPEELPLIVGRTAVRPIAANSLLSWEDLAE